MKKTNAFRPLQVDGDHYRWRIRHASLLDADAGLKGFSISVAREPGRTLELILDFPFAAFGWNQTPEKTAIVAALGPAIRAALAAGWKANSRGVPLHFQVPAAGNAS